MPHFRNISLLPPHHSFGYIFLELFKRSHLWLPIWHWETQILLTFWHDSSSQKLLNSISYLLPCILAEIIYLVFRMWTIARKHIRTRFHRWQKTISTISSLQKIPQIWKVFLMWWRSGLQRRWTILYYNRTQLKKSDRLFSKCTHQNLQAPMVCLLFSFRNSGILWEFM